MPKLQRDPEVYRFSLQWKYRKAYLQERKNILLVAQLPDRVNVWLWNRKHYADAGLNGRKLCCTVVLQR
ncbi:hypothetical protein DIPPA_24453 [Diplonema papillatum]|nr:hypothetical protein DIPPA_24453 [Diplonema papillatum]